MREDFSIELLDAVIKMRAFQRMENAEKYQTVFERKVDLLIGEWNAHVDINQKIAREALRKQDARDQAVSMD
jgi:hypothetical protein